MIKQKTIIEINSKKPLDQIGNHVLFWDSTKRCYYALSLEEFLAPQNSKIKELENKVEKFGELFNNTKKALQNDYNQFTEGINKDKQEFLASYKETNKKVLEMVKSLVETEGD